MKTGVAVVLVSIVTLRAVFAHHSFAPHFDSQKTVRVTGIVTRFDSRNPHVYLYLDAVDENGRPHAYVCMSHGATQLARVGMTPEMFSTGATVTLTGSQARNDPYICFFKTVEFPDGRVLNVDGSNGKEPTATAPAR